MANMLEYSSRLNNRVCSILEQTAANSSRKDADMSEMIKFYLQQKVIVADVISLSLDVDLNDQISKSLRYPNDSELINLPK